MSRIKSYRDFMEAMSEASIARHNFLMLDHMCAKLAVMRAEAAARRDAAEVRLRAVDGTWADVSEYQAAYTADPDPVTTSAEEYLSRIRQRVGRRS